MKAIVTLIVLILGSLVVFAGFMLLKPETPKTQEEVDLQLQLDNNKQQHELAVRNSDLDHQLSLNQQKFDHENALKQQQLETEAALQQYQMQHNLGVEQAKLAHEAIIAQQNMRKDVEIRQLDLQNQVEMQREQLTAENKQKMMELDHEVALKRQQEEGAQQRIYLLFAGGVVLIIVIAGVILVLVRNYKEAQVRLRGLEQNREFQLEEGRNLHQMRMKALDIMASFPQDERKEIILEVMHLNTQEQQPKMLNKEGHIAYDEVALPASQPTHTSHTAQAQETQQAVSPANYKTDHSAVPNADKASDIPTAMNTVSSDHADTEATTDRAVTNTDQYDRLDNNTAEKPKSEEHIVYATSVNHANGAAASLSPAAVMAGDEPNNLHTHAGQQSGQTHKKSRNIYRRKKQKSNGNKSSHYRTNNTMSDNIIDLNHHKSADPS
ncbi:MAG: hypothetical protein ACWA5U_07145 [bacterium]